METMAERASFCAALLALATIWVLGPGTEFPGSKLPRIAMARAVELNITQLREDALGMFNHGYNGYMRYGYPKDDLRPLSCRGSNSQGGIALTLIDSLDSLIVMGKAEELQRAVRLLAANATFDVDHRVHVFELTIRAVGGLLSAHMLIEQSPSLVPGYDGSLLRLAVELTDRLLPAFDTPTGVPLSWVNLRKGQVPGDTRITCTACAGTLLLEFGVLSRLTGNATYEAKARRAVETIHAMRSPRGLVGNTLDVDNGQWSRLDAGVGAGVDSYYEYLLKSYLAFGDESYLDMFAEAYAAATVNMQLSPAWNGYTWLMDVHMQTGKLLHAYVWSLGAFWPGLQVLAGQVGEAEALHANWTSAWQRWGWLPEMFEMGLDHRHPTLAGYPLRPELMESTYLLYTATRDARLLSVGAELLRALRDGTRAKCGHASIRDVNTGQLEDTMESFFLSETTKYLYLLFSNATAVVDSFVLSTEGHLFPPFPPPAGSAESMEEQQAQQAQQQAQQAQQQAQQAQQQAQQAQQQAQQAQQQQQQHRQQAKAFVGSTSSSRNDASGSAGDAKEGASSSGGGVATTQRAATTAAAAAAGAKRAAAAAAAGRLQEEVSRAERHWQRQLEQAVSSKCGWLCAAAEQVAAQQAQQQQQQQQQQQEEEEDSAEHSTVSPGGAFGTEADLEAEAEAGAGAGAQGLEAAAHSRDSSSASGGGASGRQVLTTTRSSTASNGRGQNSSPAGAAAAAAAAAVAAAGPGSIAELRAVLPLLPLDPHSPARLLRRRCNACRAVTEAVATLRKRHRDAIFQAAAARQMAVPGAGLEGGRVQPVARGKAAAAGAKQAQAQGHTHGQSHVQGQGQGQGQSSVLELGEHAAPALSSTGLPLLRQFVCKLVVTEPGKLGCSSIEEVNAVTLGQTMLSKLPSNAIVVQLTENFAVQEGPAPGMDINLEVSWGDGRTDTYRGVLAEFGPQLLEGCGVKSAAEAALEARGGEGGEGEGEAEGQQQQKQPAVATSHAWHRERRQQHHHKQPPQQQQAGEEGAAKAASAADGKAAPAETESCPHAADEPEPDSKQQQQVVHPGTRGSSGSDGSSDSGGQRVMAAAGGSQTDSTGSSDSVEAGGSTQPGSSMQLKSEEEDCGESCDEECDEDCLEEEEDEGEEVWKHDAAADDGSECEVEGPAVPAVPPEACWPLENSGIELMGAVALVWRGGCSFLDKVSAAEQEGAKAVVVVNTAEEAMSMAKDESGREVGIPAVMVPRSVGRAILDGLEAASSHQGASSDDGQSGVRLRLYATNQGPPEQQQEGTQQQQQQQQQQREGASDDGNEAAPDQAASPNSSGGKSASGAVAASASGRGSSSKAQAGKAAAGATAEGEKEEEEEYQPPPPRLELLVPSQTQAYLMDKVYGQGHDLTQVFQGVMLILQPPPEDEEDDEYEDTGEGEGQGQAEEVVREASSREVAREGSSGGGSGGKQERVSALASRQQQQQQRQQGQRAAAGAQGRAREGEASVEGAAGKGAAVQDSSGGGSGSSAQTCRDEL